MEKLERLRGRAVGIRLVPEGIDSFFDHFRTVQAEEAWACLGGWVEAAKPQFGPGVRERFAAAKATDAGRGGAGARVPSSAAGADPPAAGRRSGAGLPDQPLSAPLLTASLAEQDVVRQATIGVTAIAGLCGLPEVTAAGGNRGWRAGGISLVAAPGLDRGTARVCLRRGACLDCPV